MRIFGFRQKETTVKRVSMATTLRYHLVSIVMNISGEKFEEHCFNISGDVLYSVFYHSSCTHLMTHHFPSLHNTKTKKDIPKRKLPFFSILKSLASMLPSYLTWATSFVTLIPCLHTITKITSSTF